MPKLADAGMAEKVRSSPKKRSSYGKGGRKNPEGPPSSSRRIPPALLLAWVCALVVLVSIIYFTGRNSGNKSESTPRSSASSRAAETDRTTKLQPAAKPGIPPAPQTVQPKSPSDDSPGQDLVALSSPPKTAPEPQKPAPDVKPRPLAKVSIVIDDFGQDSAIAKKFLALPFPVTFSILPNQPHSKEIAELAHSQGREIILHCPMEPLSYPKQNPGKGALMASMSQEEILRNLGTALDTSPYFAGINNHEGSRLTQNQQAMTILMTRLKEEKLFFLDSLTTPASKAWVVARELKVPTRKRDIFLDHDSSPASVRAQILRMIQIAKVQGSALAIGHARQATLSALQEASGQFSKEKIELVPASDLMISK